MIELKLTFATFEEAADFLLARTGGPVSVEVAQKGTGTVEQEDGHDMREPEKPKPAEKVKKAPAAKKEEKVEPQPQPEPEASAEEEMTEEDAAEYFKTKVRPALAGYMSKHGQDAARQFLLDYAGLQTKSLSSLPVEHYKGFVAACEKAAA